MLFHTSSVIVLTVARSRAYHIASVAVLLLASSVEPAWQFGHAVAHGEAVHSLQRWESGPNTADPALPTVSALSGSDGHSHPVIQARLTPRSDAPPAVAAFPATVLRLPLESPAVRSLSLPGISARASPRTAGSTQSRAPPLV